MDRLLAGLTFRPRILGYAWNFPREGRGVSTPEFFRVRFYVKEVFSMRKMVLSLMSVAGMLLLAGCNKSPVPSQSADGSSAASTGATAGAAKMPSQVSGTLSLREPAQLSANATLVINLLDVSSTAAGAAPLASKTSPAGTFPQPFQLGFNPASLKADDLYVVQVMLTDGERHYAMPISAPVLTKGNKSDGVMIQLVAEQTPAEKTLAAFVDVQKQLGAMKVSHGTKLEKDASRGWQLFRQDGQIKFIRELVDYGDKGFTSTDYAYRNNRPWVVVQQTKANQAAKPSAIDRAGWDDSGNLVLQQHEADGKVQPLDAGAAAKLQKQAQDILSLATAGKNK
jgi:putative lipoprotein